MVVRYSTPGVYLESLDANSQRLDLRRTDVAGFVGITERGPAQVPMKIESWRQFTTTFGRHVPGTYLAYGVEGYFENGGRTCWVVRAADPERATAARVRLLIAGHGVLTLEATSPGAWANEIQIEAIWARDRIAFLLASAPDGRSQRIELESTRPGTALPEQLHFESNLFGVSEDHLTTFAREPLLRMIADSAWVPYQELSVSQRTAQLGGGADGHEALRQDHFIGDPERDGLWGLSSLERVDGVSFVAVPDLQAEPAVLGRTREARPLFDAAALIEAQRAMLGSCVRRGDRIAILDLPRRANRDEAVAHRNQLGESSFGAIYHPWIVGADRATPGGDVVALPPSAHVAGVYARCDRLRGVHKPPANEILEGVYDVTQVIDGQRHGDFNDNGINAIRAVPGRGVLVQGARTLARDVRQRYVNVRRLLSAIEEALDEQMQWVVFEPNSERLWSQIERTARNLLERLYRVGMLDGTTSEQAYFARCDASTNPRVETEAGRVSCLVGLQPPQPAEFIVLRIGVTRSGIDVEEKGAQDV